MQVYSAKRAAEVFLGQLVLERNGFLRQAQGTAFLTVPFEGIKEGLH